MTGLVVGGVAAAGVGVTVPATVAGLSSWRKMEAGMGEGWRIEAWAKRSTRCGSGRTVGCAALDNCDDEAGK